MLKWNLGWVMRKNEAMENSEKRKFVSPVFWWEENQRPKLWRGISYLKFFHTIYIIEMAAIFQFFIMADADIPFPLTLGKLETQTLGGFGNLKFFCMINIKEMAAIFFFFHNGRHWYFIDSGKTGDVNFLLVQFSKFSVGSVFPITHPRFCYNIHAWLPIKHLCVDIYVWWPFCTKKCQKNLPK